jgi:hypothetical protein
VTSVVPSPESNIFDETLSRKKENLGMDNVTIIRVVAGVLFVIVLVVLIQRRRTRVK